MRLSKVQGKMELQALNCKWEQCWQNETNASKNYHSEWWLVGEERQAYQDADSTAMAKCLAPKLRMAAKHLGLFKQGKSTLQLHFSGIILAAAETTAGAAKKPAGSHRPDMTTLPTLQTILRRRNYCHCLYEHSATISCVIDRSQNISRSKTKGVFHMIIVHTHLQQYSTVFSAFNWNDF